MPYLIFYPRSHIWKRKRPWLKNKHKWKPSKCFVWYCKEGETSSFYFEIAICSCN